VSARAGRPGARRREARMSRLRLLAALLALCAAQAAGAQQILIDRGAYVEGLHCYPSAVNEKHWYYIPNTVRFERDEAGRPKFSYLRYVINRPTAEGDSKGITDAEGGGILHLIVVLETPQETIAAAEQALKRVAQDPELSLRGPVLFKSGRYQLVSATITGDKLHKNVLAAGNAPVLEGSQLALSFEVGPERSTLLLESLKMANPDVQLKFEMTVEGIADAFDADMKIHWDDVYKSKEFGVSASAEFYVGVGAEIKDAIASLIQRKVIELQTRGANPNMEALLEKTQTKLLELMFDPVEPKQGSQAAGGDQMFSKMSELASAANEEEEDESPSYINVSFAYKMKEIRRSGTTVVNLNTQSPRQAVSTIAFGVGNVWKDYGGDEKMFKTVNLADPAFQQREIHVAIDGAILPEFDKYINSVTATLRKQHQNGRMTVQEVVIDRETFNKKENDFRMIYGWDGDDDRTAWLGYEYRTRWSFKGGGVYETDWTRHEANMIDLFAPYTRKVVRVLGDSALLQGKGVRAVVVEVSHPFFEETKQQQIRFRTDKPIQDQQLELTLPLNQRRYDYKITWIGPPEKPEQKGSDTSGILFVDELPEAPAPEAAAEGA
jgi:hypothetical protein